MTKKYINAKELRNLHPNKSIHLINSLGGFKSVALIGTKSEAGNTNLAIFSSIFHLGANPPLVGLIFRPIIKINILFTMFILSCLFVLKMFVGKTISEGKCIVIKVSKRRILFCIILKWMKFGWEGLVDMWLLKQRSHRRIYYSINYY